MDDQALTELPPSLLTQCRRNVCFQAWQEVDGTIGLSLREGKHDKGEFYITPDEESELLSWLLLRAAARLP